MDEEDLHALVAWYHEPHVRAWFRDPPADVTAAQVRYGGRLRGEEPARMWVASLEGAPFATVQDYPVDSDDDLAVRVQLPSAVAFDYLIGDPAQVGRGLGARMLTVFLRDVALPGHPDATWFVACPDARNVASLRVLDKLGFVQRQWIQMPGEEYAQIVCRASRDDLARTVTDG